MLLIGIFLFIGGIVGLISGYVYNSICTIPEKQYKRIREHEKAYNETPLDVHRDAFINAFAELNDHQQKFYKKEKLKELQSEKELRLRKQDALKYLKGL